MKVKTNLKVDSDYSDAPDHRLYLSLLESVYGLRIPKNNTALDDTNNPPDKTDTSNSGSKNQTTAGD